MASNQYIIFQNVKKTTQQNTRNKNIKQSPTMVQINVDIYEKQSKRKKMAPNTTRPIKARLVIEIDIITSKQRNKFKTTENDFNSASISYY